MALGQGYNADMHRKNHLCWGYHGVDASCQVNKVLIVLGLGKDDHSLCDSVSFSARWDIN